MRPHFPKFSAVECFLLPPRDKETNKNLSFSSFVCVCVYIYLYIYITIGLPIEKRCTQCTRSINIRNKKQQPGIHAILEEVMGLVYGRKLGKNGLVLSKTRSFPLVMVGGSISGKMSGVVRRPCVPDILLFSTWRQTKRPRLRTFGIEIGGMEVGLQIF